MTNTTQTETAETKLVVRLMHELAACDECGFNHRELRRQNALTLNVTEASDNYVRFYPRLIGSGAKNLRSLELVFKAAAARVGNDARLILARPRSQTSPARDKFKANYQWGIDQMLPLAKDVIRSVFGRESVTAEYDGDTVVVQAKMNDYNEVAIYESGTRTSVPQVTVLDAIENLFDCIGKSHGRPVIFTTTN